MSELCRLTRIEKAVKNTTTVIPRLTSDPANEFFG